MDSWFGIIWVIALAGWTYASVFYVPWWLARKSDDPIPMDRPRLLKILFGYGLFAIVIFLVAGPRLYQGS